MSLYSKIELVSLASHRLINISERNKLVIVRSHLVDFLMPLHLFLNQCPRTDVGDIGSSSKFPAANIKWIEKII